MNSYSSNSRSYCSSASEFCPNGESAVRWFSEFFVIFLGFQQKEEVDENALIWSGLQFVRVINVEVIFSFLNKLIEGRKAYSNSTYTRGREIPCPLANTSPQRIHWSMVWQTSIRPLEKLPNQPIQSSHCSCKNRLEIVAWARPT